jgi:hypothetical protein
MLCSDRPAGRWRARITSRAAIRSARPSTRVPQWSAR